LSSLHALHLPAPDRPAGLAVLDGKGQLQSHESLEGEGWLDALAARLEQDGAQALVVPAQTSDTERQAALRRRLADRYALKAVRTAGLSEARETAELDAALPREVASAVVLGRRAQTPFAEWSRVDPVSCMHTMQ